MARRSGRARGVVGAAGALSRGALVAWMAVVGCDGEGGDDAGALDGAPADARSADGGVDAGEPPPPTCLRMVPLRLWTTDPSAVAMLYRIETCEGETVVLDPGPGESVLDYYALTEDERDLSSDAVAQVDVSGPQRAYVTLLLDFSAPTRAVITEVLAAARVFVDTLVPASERVWVGIELFDGRADVVTIQRPTPDLEELRAAITSLASDADPDADDGAANLHGALLASVERLQSWQEQVVARNDLGLATSGYVVAFTHGRDTAMRVPAEDAAAAVASASAATGAGRGNVQTYAVALAGADFTAAARADLSRLLDDEGRLYEGAPSELSTAFTQLADRIAEQAEATHLLTYCSSARSGELEAELSILASRGGATNKIVFRFSAEGFGAGCAELVEARCVDRGCGGLHCGGCDERSEQCIGGSGQCVSECVERDRCSGETITTDLGYEVTCDASSLGPTVLECGGGCVDTASDDAHCGGCGGACETLGGSGERCVEGECRCPGGGQVCDGACRAPSFFQSDGAHCGSCGNACGGGSSCISGACVCPGGGVFCDGACRDASYFEAASDCGACGNACTASGQGCVAGACACPGTTPMVCGAACRDLASDAANCGACGHACTNAGESCVSGTCRCPSGQTVCAGRCVDLTSSAAHCGSCGNACPGSGQSCVGGTCSCPGTTPMICGGVCRDVATDAAHCGGCGDACASTQACVAGSCACPGVDGALCGGVCRDLASSPGDCGSCGNACLATQSCVAGACMCPPAQSLCEGACRDASFYATNARHCGGCANACSAACVSSACVGVTDLAVGANHSCAVLTNGTARCWGRNLESQLSGTTPFLRRTPGPVFGPLTGAAEITAGNAHSCARMTDGTAQCWGDNLYGALGDRTFVERPAPVAVYGLSNVTQLSAGYAHTCAVRADGSAWCWGRNDSQQLGDGPGADRSEPRAVAGLTGVRQISAGFGHTCAVLTDGTARCWGLNDDGQLGDGTITTRSAPVAVVGLSGVAWISAGLNFTCAVRTDGAVRCWGRNDVGQLGDGTTTSRSSPAVVSGLAGASHVSAGSYHACATLAGGTARCWGANGDGKLGDGTTTDRTTPSTVVGLSGAREVWAGQRHSCAWLTDQSVRCWGENVTGQLGDGTSTVRFIAAPVVW